MAHEGQPWNGVEFGENSLVAHRLPPPLSLLSCQVEDLERVKVMSGKQLESFLKVSLWLRHPPPSFSQLEP